MSSIFSKIVRNELPSFNVYENENHIAFLDINPLKIGHTLVIPKKEIDYIFDINSKEYDELWNFAKIVAKGMRKVIECERISIVVMGLDVPHAHIHLIPFNNINDIDFSKPKLKISNEEMQKTADLIKNAI
ncbi:HIT family protein [bacterium]|nr:HIT family protein [bacterium]